MSMRAFKHLRIDLHRLSVCGRTAVDYSLSPSWGNWQVTEADIQWRDLFNPAHSGSTEEGWCFSNASCGADGKHSPAAPASGTEDLRWWHEAGELQPFARVCANLQQLSKHKDEALPQAFLQPRYPHSCADHTVSTADNTPVWKDGPALQVDNYICRHFLLFLWRRKKTKNNNAHVELFLGYCKKKLTHEIKKKTNLIFYGIWKKIKKK